MKDFNQMTPEDVVRSKFRLARLLGPVNAFVDGTNDATSEEEAAYWLLTILYLEHVPCNPVWQGIALELAEVAVWCSQDEYSDPWGGDSPS